MCIFLCFTIAEKKDISRGLNMSARNVRRLEKATLIAAEIVSLKRKPVMKLNELRAFAYICLHSPSALQTDSGKNLR